LALRESPGWATQRRYRCVMVSIWRPRTARNSSRPSWAGRAWTAPDGLTLQIEAHGGKATDFLSVAIAESRTAVLARAITRERSGRVRPVGITKRMTTTLSAPLGDRVLVNEYGSPFEVLPMGAVPHGHVASVKVLLGS
jgi:hypothetical protein